MKNKDLIQTLSYFDEEAEVVINIDDQLSISINGKIICHVDIEEATPTFYYVEDI